MTGENMESIQLRDTEAKGRGLQATKDLGVGEVVFTEPSFAAVVFDSLSSQVCHCCFSHHSNLHRCGQCRFAHYCDRTCQTACWEEHKQECAAIRKHGKAPRENVRLVARVLWRIQKDTGIVLDGQLVSVDQLKEHVADLSEDALEELKMDVKSFLAYWPRGRSQYSEEYISHLLSMISCNSFTMSDQRGLQAVGVGLFPNLALVNHDCWPNCTMILNHGNKTALNSALHSQPRVELRALGKIEEGAELTMSYVDFLNLSADRQRKLKQQYHFDCTCEHCSNHIKDDLMKAVKEDDGKKPSDDVVKEVVAFSKNCLEKIEHFRAAGDYEEVLKLCHESLAKQDPVLADTHISKLRTLSIASDVLSYLRKFSEAAELAHRMVKGYRKLYHHNNAQLGMATMRAGVIHWHAGKIEVGHEMICKAYAILLITHGPNHPITRDLEAIRTQTEIELKMFKENEGVYHSVRETVLKGKPMGMAAEPAADEAREH